MPAPASRSPAASMIASHTRLRQPRLVTLRQHDAADVDEHQQVAVERLQRRQSSPITIVACTTPPLLTIQRQEPCAITVCGPA